MRTVLFSVALAFLGCASAPANQWTPIERTSTNVSVAKTTELSPPAKAVEASAAPTPRATSPIPSTTVAVESASTALPPEPQPVVEAKPAQPPPADPKQASIDRAKAAITLLDNASNEVRPAVCSARSLLQQVPDVYRQEPLVLEAQKRLKSKEPAALKEELAEFEENRMYLCRDNTPSPTCHCKGPKRGCCSHHGGVAGCEPLPTEITCP